MGVRAFFWYKRTAGAKNKPAHARTPRARGVQGLEPARGGFQRHGWGVVGVGWCSPIWRGQKFLFTLLAGVDTCGTIPGVFCQQVRRLRNLTDAKIAPGFINVVTVSFLRCVTLEYSSMRRFRTYPPVYSSHPHSPLRISAACRTEQTVT